MAWLEQSSPSDRFKICFRWNGQKKRRTLHTSEAKAAEAILLRFEETLDLLDRGRLELPPTADIMTFLLSDGKLASSPKSHSVKPRTLREIADRYVSALGNGSVEANSLVTLRLHLSHVLRKFGDGFPLQNLVTADLQDYLDKRIRRKGKKSIPLSSVTLRKEVASLRACFNWAVQTCLIVGTFPNRGLRFPKGEDKRPFMTWEEIARRVARGGLAAEEKKRLWDCLFLDLEQTGEFLEFVKAHATRPWIYPMCVAAAHTGARRSELVRLQVDDIDLEGKTVLIQERKRVKGQRSMRRIPLTPFLEQVVVEWLNGSHPGGHHLFGQRPKSGKDADEVRTAVPVISATVDDAWIQFTRTVKGSKWAVLKGWHVLRHSFASNLAAKGVDQRFIDEFMGHQTEVQRRRYRHLFPHQQRQMLCEVFGN